MEGQTRAIWKAYLMWQRTRAQTDYDAWEFDKQRGDSSSLLCSAWAGKQSQTKARITGQRSLVIRPVRPKVDHARALHHDHSYPAFPLVSPTFPHISRPSHGAPYNDQGGEDWCARHMLYGYSQLSIARFPLILPLLRDASQHSPRR